LILIYIAKLHYQYLWSFLVLKTFFDSLFLFC